jgi:hypothetical protein
MHELLNTRTNEIISFPQDIDELTPEQYLFYLDLALQQLTGAITDPQEIKRKLFVKFTDLRVSKKMAFYTEETEDAIWVALTEKINLLDSFFDIERSPLTPKGGTDQVYSLHLKSGINLLPTWNGLIGPADMLSNITWGDFVNCLNAMKLISLAQAEGDVGEIESNTKEIFEILYRPTPNPQMGAKRKTHKSWWKRNTKHKTRNAKHEIPDTVLYHALTYFSYVYELITTVPIPINGEEVDFSIIWKSDGDDDDQNKNDKSGWAGILFSIAETGIFGKTNDVNESNLYDVLMYLYSRKMQVIAEKKKTPNPQMGA